MKLLRVFAEIAEKRHSLTGSSDFILRPILDRACVQTLRSTR
jgi:hypothetical protein